MKTILNKSVLRIGGAALSIVMALSMLAVALPQTAQAAGSTTAVCSDQYVVQAGDTRSSIAANYSLKWWQIASANHLAPNAQLVTGSTLCIPTEKWAANAMPGAMTASAVGKVLTVKMSDFNTRSVWSVRVKDANSGMNDYYKVGQIVAPQNGSATGIYNLPQELHQTPLLKVCVTNVASSITMCETIKHAL